MNQFTALLAGLLGAMVAFAIGAADSAPVAADALVEQGIRRENGEGVAKNAMRASELYCAAARQGSAEGAYRLGWMYSIGRGIERDDGLAVGLFKRAAASGHEYAKRMLDRIHSDHVRLPDCINLPVPVAAAQAELSAAQQLADAERRKAESALVELARVQQLALAEKERALTAQSERAKFEQLVPIERAKADAAAAELAKVEQQAQAERARTESIGVELSKAEALAQAERGRAESATSRLASAQQTIQTERQRAAAAEAERARVGQLLAAERAKADAAAAELAKVDQQAQAERARAESARAQVPVISGKGAAEGPSEGTVGVDRVASPRAVADASKAGSGSVADLLAARDEISMVISAWAKAWSQKDFNSYFATYDSDFLLVDGQSNQQWKRERRSRIADKAWIAVSTRDLDIHIDGNLAKAKFLQQYRSDKFSESGYKILTLVKVAGTWRIRKEQSEK